MIVQISSDNSIEISFAIIYEHKNKIKKKELMLANPQFSQTLKLNLTHNISKAVMMEIRFDSSQTIADVKVQIHKRYGSDPNSVQLVLKDKNGNTICQLNNDAAQLGQYQVIDGYFIHVIDSNPHSVLKEIEDTSLIQKYEISDEKYNELPNTFRKFKQQLEQNQAAGNVNNTQTIDDNYMQQEAMNLNLNVRCRLFSNDNRGTIKYIGQIPQMGLGYFVGIQLDEPSGNNNGSIGGYAYFHCQHKYGIFVRPNELEAGNFPELDLDDEI